LDKDNPNDQIEASIKLLAIEKKSNGDWIDAAIAYHTGSGSISTNLPVLKNHNSAIVALMISGTDTLEEYKIATAKYYGLNVTKIDPTYRINVTQYTVNQMTDIKSFAGKIKIGDMTYCSRTTRIDAENMFGVNLPH
jgi:hypothetical protein